MKDVYLLERMTYLLKTWMLYEKEEAITCVGPNGELTPLFLNGNLRRSMIDGAKQQECPYVICDEFDTYYCCIKEKEQNGYYLLGPFATRFLDRFALHRYYKKYGIEEGQDKKLPIQSITEVLVGICTMNYLINQVQLSDSDIIKGNHLLEVSRQAEDENRILFDLWSEEEEEIEYRHTFQEERNMMDQIREGNVEAAVKQAKIMERDVGRLGKSEVIHWRNFLIVASTLSARAAIDAGISPLQAYRLSGYYINYANQCDDVRQLISYKNHMTENFAKLVAEQKAKRHISSYTQQCKDYVHKHYREKIYLEDIAKTLNISPSYLSRLFKEEMGRNLQDYIVDVRVERAANLLTFSEERIPAIAEYVNFPSQSYFGKVFKERMHMTPRQYRERHKPTEFIETIR
ncbi:MAG: helix-turn-helix transcriptional regulator [Blautia sp.]|nr:helix-turn-helix transcriptional regulator [Blautia sp.]